MSERIRDKAKDRAICAAWRSKNPDKVKAGNAKRYLTKSNKDRVRNGDLLRKYGITLEQYNEILENQDGVCALCKRIETVVMRGKVINLAVDHNHETGANRGLLCQHCNRHRVGRYEALSQDNEMLEYLALHDKGR